MSGVEEHRIMRQKWSRKELLDVYKLYHEIGGKGIHEFNPKIIELGERIGRPIRAVEAQLIMYRNLDRGGDYSRGNMSQIIREIWSEYNQNESFELSNSPNQGLQESKDLDFEFKDYHSWNKDLIKHFFNPSMEGREVECIPVHENLFWDVTDSALGFEDYLESIQKIIGSGTFTEKLKWLYHESAPRHHEGRILRKPFPEYFGFLIYLIHALSEYDEEDLWASNVYDRINNYGQIHFGEKWGVLNTAFSRDVLEPIWEDLEDWSINHKRRQWGYFVRRDPKIWNRAYVSRLERHALLNSKQFDTLFDIMVDRGIGTDELLGSEDWCDLVQNNLDKIHNGNRILQYLSEETHLRESVINFLNNYKKNHYTTAFVSSGRTSFRSPPIPLRVCIKEVPTWANEEISTISFRAESTDFGEDKIRVEIGTIPVEHEYGDFSTKIDLGFIPDTDLILQGDSQRYLYKKKAHWLTKHHQLGEWVETEQPTNGVPFILILPNEKIKSLKEDGKGLNYLTHPIIGLNMEAYVFGILNQEDFKKVYFIYNPTDRLEGKIGLLGDFNLNQRRTIFKEFNPLFAYHGPLTDPQLILKSNENNIQKDLLKVEVVNEPTFMLPKIDFEIDTFHILEKSTLLRSHFNYTFGDLEAQPTNLRRSVFRDHDGTILDLKNSEDLGVYDIPKKFSRIFGTTEFNTWHRSLFSVFNPRKPIAHIKKDGLIYDGNHVGNKLLSFISLSNNISTWDFPKLVAQLEPKISPAFARRLMEYWKNLGYINFEAYGGKVSVSPPSIFFLSSKGGLKGLITGYRNLDLVESLVRACRKINIDIIISSHSNENSGIFPQKITLIDPDCDIEKFFRLKKQLGLVFVNNIRNAFNDEYVVYQLACLLMQRSVKEFRGKLKDYSNYSTDHHRKRILDKSELKWKDTTRSIDSLPLGTLIRYDGFKDRSVTHVIKSEVGNKEINDLGMGIFSTIDKHILKKRESSIKDHYDLLVPLYIPLPYWIEKGAIMVNAEIPKLENIDRRTYRVYSTLNHKILEVVVNKLNQIPKLL